MLRETSVLGRRLAGKGIGSGASVTMVIEGEDEGVMKSGVRCLECDSVRVGGEDEAASREVFIGNSRWACPGRGELVGQTRLSMSLFLHGNRIGPRLKRQNLCKREATTVAVKAENNVLRSARDTARKGL